MGTEIPPSHTGGDPDEEYETAFRRRLWWSVSDSSSVVHNILDIMKSCVEIWVCVLLSQSALTCVVTMGNEMSKTKTLVPELLQEKTKLVENSFLPADGRK